MKGLLILVIIAVIVVASFALLGPREKKSQAATLELAPSGLERLEQGHYEAWIIGGEDRVTADVGQTPFSVGKFNIGDNLSFDVPEGISDTHSFAVTIEPEGDADNSPSGIMLLEGTFTQGRAVLSFPVDFSQVAGSYVLATPTDQDDTNERSGVWFIQLPSPVSAGLALPELPEGWLYEGWAVYQGVPLTTGKFSSTTNADMFAGFSGAEQAPAFPGEDFLENNPQGVEFPIDLADGSSLVVISIEPNAGGSDPTGDGPFAVKPLIANVPKDASDHTNYQMQLNLGGLPAGTATIIAASE